MISCVLGKPFTHFFTPASRRLNAALNAYIILNFVSRSNPPLTSYTNCSFVNANGSTKECLVGSNPLTSNYVPISAVLVNSVQLYGKYSIVLTNSSESTATGFQVLPPGKSAQIYMYFIGLFLHRPLLPLDFALHPYLRIATVGFRIYHLQ